MERIVFLSLVLTILSGSCVQEKDSQIEGSWKLVSSLIYGLDSIPYHGQAEDKTIKMYSINHVMSVSQFFHNQNLVQNFGFGTYSIIGDIIIENFSFRSNPGAVFGEEKMLLEINKDTLIQIGTVDNTGKIINKKDYFVNKYIRVR